MKPWQVYAVLVIIGILKLDVIMPRLFLRRKRTSRPVGTVRKAKP